MDKSKLSSLSSHLISAIEKSENTVQDESKITVNRVVSEVATWYERIRNAMDYRADEVILRAAIERIVKRRMLLGGNGVSIAEPLVRELIWARYFPDGTVPEGIILQVAETIDFYLDLRRGILTKHSKLSEAKVDEWAFHLLSAHVEHVLNPSIDEDMIRNFMFQILKKNVTIEDDSEKTRDAQVFLAVCRAYAKDDLAFLRFHLFNQFFEEVNKDSLPRIVQSFMEYYNEAQKQLNYPLRERIYSFIKSQTPPFLILTDVIRSIKGPLRSSAQALRLVLENEEELKKMVFTACEKRYSEIRGKFQRAIIRSVIFLFATKALFALTIEGTYETLIYGEVLWTSMALNVSIPPLLMILVGFFIRTPKRDNTERIFSTIKTLLSSENPNIGKTIKLTLEPSKKRPLMNAAFSILWFGAFLLSFGLLYYLLDKLGFNVLNKGVFMFFFTIVAFLSFRISQSASAYNYNQKESLITPIVDFFFMPIIQVGRRLTEGISQLNLFLFIFDFIIETPFKGLFSFFEQWFLFLHAKREELG